MNFRILYLLLLLQVPATLFPQSGIYSDGPYIFYTPEGVRVTGFRDSPGGHNARRLIDTLYLRIADMGDIKVGDDKGHWVFTVPSAYLNEFPACNDEGAPVSVEPARNVVPRGGKIFVISDSHGNFKNFISILKTAGVINDKLEWSYGKNRLVILGDTFDRGNDVLAIFWLIYSLEKQASGAGGALTYILGNHDNMVLKGDLRYIKEKYKTLQDTLDIPYDRFFSSGTHLGRWLRSKNSIEIIGNTLFVHGGISPLFAQSGISVNRANELIRENLDTRKKDYGDTVKFLMGSDGPLWYRGLVSDEEKYNPIGSKDLKAVIKKYKISRIVVGHTTFDGVKFHHGGKVISVDSKNEKLKISHLYQGVEIDGSKIKVVTVSAI